MLAVKPRYKSSISEPLIQIISSLIIICVFGFSAILVKSILPIFIAVVASAVGIIIFYIKSIRQLYTLRFYDNYIEQHLLFKKRSLQLDYSTLQEVSFQLGGTMSKMIFTCIQKNDKYKFRTDVFVRDKTALEFLLWLKSKNPSFKTHVWPPDKILKVNIRNVYREYGFLEETDRD